MLPGQKTTETMRHPFPKIYMCGTGRGREDNKVLLRAPGPTNPQQPGVMSEYPGKGGYYPIRLHQKDVNAAEVTWIEHQPN